jgi:hypothetical protein
MVIDAEFGRKDHNSIPTTAIKKELEPFNFRTDPEPDSTYDAVCFDIYNYKYPLKLSEGNVEKS